MGRIIPSVQATDFGTAYGLGAHYVHDTTNTSDGQFFFTLRGGYKLGRPHNADTHAHGYSAGADLQLNQNAAPYGQFIVSGDFGGVKDGERSAGPTLEWDHITDRAGRGTFSVTATYLTLFPKTGDTSSDIIPGVAYEYSVRLKNPLKLAAEYTFKNDLDGEDDYAVSARFKLGEASLRFGVGKSGRVFVTLTQILARE